MLCLEMMVDRRAQRVPPTSKANLNKQKYVCVKIQEG
jgi:hypothetical protein